MSRSSGFEDTLKLICLLLLGFFAFFMFFHLESIRWNPWFGIGGEEVFARDVHKWGFNNFHYKEQTEPFTGVAVEYVNKSEGKLSLEKVFLMGMLHTKTIFHPQTGREIFVFKYMNEKVKEVIAYDAEGNFLSQGTIEEVLPLVRKARLDAHFRPEAN